MFAKVRVIEIARVSGGGGGRSTERATAKSITIAVGSVV
jgi:hypothetical protein